MSGPLGKVVNYDRQGGWSFWAQKKEEWGRELSEEYTKTGKRKKRKDTGKKLATAARFS